ncbi:MAG: hypothetical protein NC429_16630, partial [Lachnospiraceae bacterium]|nr:hypothetical protein [Lachnospiraceae bacterium]
MQAFASPKWQFLMSLTIKVRKDAWLTLFSSDEPDKIAELIKAYPEFREIYKEAYGICLNVERVMDMFSKELYELDKNTVQYMIDEMQETIDQQKDKLGEQESAISKREAKIDEQNAKIREQNSEISRQEAMIQEQKQTIDETWKHGIKNAAALLKNLKMPEQEIKTRICEQFQISAEQVQEFLV